MASGELPSIGEWGNFETNPLFSTYGWLDFELPISPVIIDYCERAFDRLAYQFQSSEKFKDLICSYVSEIQEIEYVLSDMKNLSFLTIASGPILNALGSIVGLSRQIDPNTGVLWIDSVYRTRIGVQILVNGSNGNPDVLIQIVEGLTASTSIDYLEVYPAKFRMIIDGFDPDLVRNIKKAKPAGVGFEIGSTFGLTPIYSFADEIDVLPDAEGLAEFGDPGSGGHFTEQLVI